MGCNSGFHVQAESRGELQPDPRFDAINVVVLAFQEDNDSKINVFVLLRSNIEQDQCNPDGISDWKVFASSEEKLFSHFMNIIRSIDPDILMGWDIQGSSLGYLAERAMHLGISLLYGILRTPTETKVAARESGVSDTGMLDNLLPEPLVSDSIQLGDLIIDDKWGRTHASGLPVGGYSGLKTLTLTNQTIRLGSFEVLVYSEVASRPAMECLPLVMEPEFGFYADPVVLDFQSLYPLMIIAYNLCFCTCLGNVMPSKANTLGVSSFSPDLHVLRDLILWGIFFES
ncbi:hypothetical protein RHSIM_Rhsim07G0183900 [Rhododendron simsii]|uniref:DNA polymerase zeta catalytic subunit n=1 Tax=Rhododendron simsii TaxID=118357 RepID=A0A834GQ99_RHOSS|nr:hypothetical protein RHSIM_Rhsim07G0183900 [Rhododendron simsii]